MLGVESLLVLALTQAPGAHQRTYIELARAALMNPVSHENLSRAVLSRDGVSRIRVLFEESVQNSLSVGGAPVAPELGGEAILDAGAIVWIRYPDPLHPLVREAILRKGDPAALLAFFESSVDGRWLLKNTGGVHALLFQMASTPPTSDQRALLDTVLGRMVAQHFKTWSTDPEIQARMIETTDWRGRYVGFWHIHPPRLSGATALEGIEPSMADMQNAVQLGQFLTIVFQPNGFDVYDLAPLAASRRAELTGVKVIRHRSDEWQRYFEEMLSSLVVPARPVN